MNIYKFYQGLAHILFFIRYCFGASNFHIASHIKVGFKVGVILECFIFALTLLHTHTTLTAAALAEDGGQPSLSATTSRTPTVSSPTVALPTVASPVATTPRSTSSARNSKYVLQIDWRSLEETLLSTKALNKPIFLLIEAPWNYENELFVQKTLTNPQVVELLNKHYLPVRLNAVDHPDIAAIYLKENYPSVTILTAERDLVTNFEGLKSPENLTVLLHEKKDNPRPVPIATIPNTTGSLSVGSVLVSEKERQLLINRLLTTLDLTAGGISASQKALPATLLRYLLANYSGFNQQTAVIQDFVKKTLSANFNLYDAVWGGVYRASALGRWNTPYYEKLASVQADNIIVYAMAYASLNNPAYQKAAIATGQYLKSHFKNPEGRYPEGLYIEGEYGFTNIDGKPKPETFFSYDERSRKLYDKPKQSDRVFTGTNFAIVEAFCALYVLTADKEWLAEAEQLAHRLLDSNNQDNSDFNGSIKPEQARNAAATEVGGNDITTAWGFRHLAGMGKTGLNKTDVIQPALQTTSQESAIPGTSSPMFIGDSLRAATALLTLYETTGNIYWREESRKVFYFISTTFVEETSVQTTAQTPLGQQMFGVVSSTRQASKHWFQRRTIEDNLGLFILAVRLYYYYPEASIKQALDTTKQFLLASISTNSPTSLLFADLLYRTRPLNYYFINTTGSEKDLAFFQDWIRSAASYTYPLKSITIGLSKETNYSYTQLNIGFPEFSKPVAYICQHHSCSLAIETPEELKGEADRILKRQ